jgi:ParB family chromosome partitioning protein
MNKKALGKGLKAFLPEDYGILKEERFAELETEMLRPNPLQPRKRFDPVAINELAQSIKETGVLQPLIVVPDKNHYRIIVGERRWRAAQIIGLKTLPAIIRNMSAEQQLEAALIENLQREDLNPLEIATAYQKMTQDLHLTQEQVAEKVGKDRTSVANYIRLLKLPPQIQDMISEGKLSLGHAKALLALSDLTLLSAMALLIVKKDLSVRTTETLVKKRIQDSPPQKKAERDPNLSALQEEFLQILGTKVSIAGTSNRGIVKIYYYSASELDRIYEKIKGEYQ